MLVNAYEKYRFLCILLYIYLNIIMYGNTGFLQCISCTDGTWNSFNLKVISAADFLL